MTIFWTKERKEETITLRRLMPSRRWTRIEAEVNIYPCQGQGRVGRAVNQLLKGARGRCGRDLMFISGDKPATTIDKKNWG